MSEHFVKYINIEKYKCFSNFSAEGFGRVNLISGKNNVGKTALMEALLLSCRANSASKLLKGLRLFHYQRNKLELIGGNLDEENLKQDTLNQTGVLKIESSLNTISLDYENSELARNCIIQINENILRTSLNEIDFRSIGKNSPDEEKVAFFIPVSGHGNKWLIQNYATIQERDREHEVSDYIQSLDSEIDKIKIIGGKNFKCKVHEGDGKEAYRDINEFGDGLRQYLTIIIAIFGANNSYISIDEIGNGIHYTSLDKLWEIILTLSKELNVQVFATTHSMECIESYCRVAEKLKDDDISFTTLVKNKESAVKAIVRDYEVFTDSIHDEREVRGW